MVSWTIKKSYLNPSDFGSITNRNEYRIITLLHYVTLPLMVEQVIGGVSFKLFLEFTSTSLCVFEVCEARVPESGYLTHACWEVQGVWLISDLAFSIVKYDPLCQIP
jgi:hypothetical protein